MNALKGWSIGVTAAAILGTVGVLSSSKSAEERAMDGMYLNEINYDIEGDTMSYQAPSLFDAYILTNIPMDSIRESIRTKRQVDGYTFSVERN